MKTMKRIKLSQFLAILLITSGNLLAQTQEKMKKNYPLNSIASISVNTQHTKLVFETWNRNELGIEAFIDSENLSKEEVTKALAEWQISIKGDRNNMRIESQPGSFGSFPPMPGLDSLGNMTAGMIGPLMEGLGPMIQSISQHPPLPPEFMASVGSLKFDHEAYERDGEEYMKKWEAQFEKKFGKEMEASMEEWSKNFEKDAEKWSAKMEVEMEAWGEEYGKEMEKWAESFGKEMEVWGEQFGKQMEAWAQQFEEGEKAKNLHGAHSMVISGGETKTRKTLIVRIPKDATLKLDVRFGEVQLADKTIDLQAKISHGKLVANSIEGPKTKVEVSYSPVKIKAWEYGVLNTNYVQNLSIDRARSLKLSSISSNVKIGEINETAVISGTFGNLDILKLSPNFKSLDISLENSDLDLNIPDSALNFNYTGAQSSIEYPSSIKAKPVKSYDSELINGYQKSADGTGIVIIKARFSDVKVK